MAIYRSPCPCWPPLGVTVGTLIAESALCSPPIPGDSTTNFLFSVSSASSSGSYFDKCSAYLLHGLCNGSFSTATGIFAATWWISQRCLRLELKLEPCPRLARLASSAKGYKSDLVCPQPKFFPGTPQHLLCPSLRSSTGTWDGAGPLEPVPCYTQMPISVASSEPQSPSSPVQTRGKEGAHNQSLTWDLSESIFQFMLNLKIKRGFICFLTGGNSHCPSPTSQ